MKKLLYNDEKVALFYDDETKMYCEYERDKNINGIGTLSNKPPKWYVRMMKIESVLLENSPH